MKKIVLILLSFSLIISCSNDDSISIDEAIVGKWQEVEFIDDIIDSNNEYDMLGLWTPVVDGDIIEFKSNGQLISIESVGQVVNRYEVRNGKVFFYLGNHEVEENYEIDDQGFLILSTWYLSRKYIKI